MDFQKLLGTRPLFFDGAMGTMLQKSGLAAGEVPESWNIAHPDAIARIHGAYLDAGCDIVKANTFGANPLKMRDCAASIRAGVEIARASCGEGALVALDIGPTGRLLKPFGDLAFEDALDSFAQVVRAGAPGCDIVLIETFSDLFEVKAAVLAAKEHCDLPVVVTLSFDEDGQLLTGATVEAAVALLEGLRVSALGFNCGLGPREMLKLLPRLAACTSIPIAINPNAGLPVSVDGRAVYRVAPAEFAETMRELVAGGAWLIGGCCGTTPEHIRKTTRCVREMPLVPLSPKRLTVVSSYAKACSFGALAPLVIGERLNPTGKPRIKQALREGDMETLLREGLAQVAAGAQILDVNVGLPGIDEVETLAQVVSALEGVIDVPLQIDTANPEAIERALRGYAGKALINSVSGKRASMDAVFPLVQKYGGCVVALPLDEDGIPESAEGRIAIARKILAEAARYGIAREDILIDGLTMAVSAASGGAVATLECVRRARRDLGVHTVLGVSNVSFGLPERPGMNAAFFAMALGAGLSAGIINPLNAPMMDAYWASRALIGCDDACKGYMAHFAGRAQGALPAPEEMTLREAIVGGLKGEAYKKAEALLKTLAPLEVIDGQLIPALDEVGHGFERKTLFLPQLLLSADAARAGFDAIRAHIFAHGGAQQSRGRVILATVQGDIHDIGKNIVKVLLQNYGFEVMDLGKDVPPEAIVATATRERIKLIGLSALMTTTVVSMEKTIHLLRAAGDYRIMVGGAVLTKDYAASIGADFYAKDAMQSVRYASGVLAEI
ncbi:MAG: homocysteine S-methyltransferase family protein [Clostridia bacterium]